MSSGVDGILAAREPIRARAAAPFAYRDSLEHAAFEHLFDTAPTPDGKPGLASAAEAHETDRVAAHEFPRTEIEQSPAGAGEIVRQRDEGATSTSREAAATVPTAARRAMATSIPTPVYAPRVERAGDGLPEADLARKLAAAAAQERQEERVQVAVDAQGRIEVYMRVRPEAPGTQASIERKDVVTRIVRAARRLLARLVVNGRTA